ncbi:Ig-like domain-containing protein [Sporolactobacillus sp. CQH2019]|uniref:Ig-like domain-containing protein n=1 Tax=Sporolactobacillus sp. CQH2019 TaxID=3023512 RepID=UPI0023681AB6|nr:Ig-like domain-containing protein [Sporolactobacillus sp. CQH2019]MDD9148210.1 Ig-like domain-containing protein [Sporolactobacillus sp. CQH2019]
MFCPPEKLLGEMKNIKGTIRLAALIFFVSCFMALFSYSASAAAVNLPVRGIIDSPRQNSTLQGVINVRGWYLDANGVGKVEAFVDGRIVGRARYGLPRTDVARVYPKYHNRNSGYQYTLDTRKLSTGRHTLLIRETGTKGNQSIVTRTIDVRVAPAYGVMDAPRQNAAVQGIINIRGWYLSINGVRQVDVLVDGKAAGRAVYGLPRPDVAGAYPNYNNRNPGYQYALDTKKLTNGRHTLSVRTTEGSGKQSTVTRAVNVSNSSSTPVCGIIDSPANNAAVQGTVNIRGWYLSGKGVSKVEVYVDGKIAGKAVYGISRPDVAKAYPDYKNRNAGYQYTLDTRKLSTGRHTLQIRATENGGAQSAVTRTVTVRNAPALGTIDSPQQNSTVQGTVPVKGWFMNGSGVSKVEVFVDGKIVGRAQYGLARPDVYKKYPAYGNHNSGYQYDLKTALSAGRHTLLVRETGVNGEQAAVSRTVYASQLPSGALKKGVDISNNNGAINFQSVKNSGINFIVQKASEGSSFTDWTFKNNVTAARAAGLETNAYHFFQSTNNASDARKEANLFAALLKSVGFNGYAFVDVEITNGASSTAITNSVNAFLDQMKQDGITKLGIYSYLSFYENNISLSVLEKSNPDLLVWTAAWHSASSGPGFDTDLWQYTDNGSVSGISGPVDMDFSFNYNF